MNTPIPLLRRGGRQFPSRKRGDCDSNRGVVDGVVADTPLKEGNELRYSPPPCLALRASVNGLTDSPSVLYGAHYSSHQHPSPSEGEDKGGGRGFRGNIPLTILGSEKIMKSITKRINS